MSDVCWEKARTEERSDEGMVKDAKRQHWCWAHK